MHEIRDWSVVHWSVSNGDTEPTPGIIYSGDHDGARRVYDRYAQAGAVVELRYQPPPVRQPERLIDHTHKTVRCGINVWRTAQWADPCFLPKGHDGPHRAAADQDPVPSEVEILRAEVERLRAGLDALVDAAETFSTEASYAVATSVEEDFVAALDDARSLVASGEELAPGDE